MPGPRARELSEAVACGEPKVTLLRALNGARLPARLRRSGRLANFTSSTLNGHNSGRRRRTARIERATCRGVVLRSTESWRGASRLRAGRLRRFAPPLGPPSAATHREKRPKAVRGARPEARARGVRARELARRAMPRARDARERAGAAQHGLRRRPRTSRTLEANRRCSRGPRERARARERSRAPPCRARAARWNACARRDALGEAVRARRARRKRFDGVVEDARERIFRPRILRGVRPGRTRPHFRRPTRWRRPGGAQNSAARTH